MVNPSRRKRSSPSSSSSGSRRPHSSDEDSSPDPPILRRRRSSRGNSAVAELARDICIDRKRVLFITGAGISVASGVRPFRGTGGVWTQHIWSTATREAFRKDPLKWYNDFWLPCLSLPPNTQPNISHHVLAQLLKVFSNVTMITQNVDGLHMIDGMNSSMSPSSPDVGSRLIEAHGRLGLYKCIPEEDSDTDSDSDDDDERLVHLGHRRKHRTVRRACRYQQASSLTVDQVEPARIRDTLMSGKGPIPVPPRCPDCRNPMAPQALLFDEGYHSHDFYQFQRMEDWLSKAEILVFVGTSFNVRLPEIALEHARAASIPVYNFNTQDLLEATVRLNATNCKGPSEETLPKLLDEIEQLMDKANAATTTTTASGKSPTTSPRARPSTNSALARGTIPVKS